MYSSHMTHINQLDSSTTVIRFNITHMLCSIHVMLHIILQLAAELMSPSPMPECKTVHSYIVKSGINPGKGIEYYVTMQEFDYAHNAYI